MRTTMRTTTTTTTTTPNQTVRVLACAFHAQLGANTDALFANEIDHATHGERNGKIWRSIEACGRATNLAVLALIRGDTEDFEALVGDPKGV